MNNITYIYIYIYVHISLSLYIYIYTHNRHLGLIKFAPPYFVFFPQTTLFTIHILSNRPDIYKIMAKTLLI